MDLEVRPVEGAGAVCALCRDALSEPTVGCGACAARVHEACARELGGCPTLACRGAWVPGSSAPPRPAPAPSATPTAPTPAARRRPRRWVFAAGLALLVAAAWASTWRRPEGAERVLGGWFSGHGSFAAAVITTFGPPAPRGVGGAGVEALVFSPDGARLYSVAGGELLWWDVASGASLGRGRLDLPGPTPWLALSDDGQRLLVPTGSTAELWDSQTMERIGQLSGLSLRSPERVPDDEPWRAVRLVAGVFSAQGPLLACAWPGAVMIYDLQGKRRGRLKTAGERVSRVAFAPGGARVAVTSSGPTWEDPRTQVWELLGDDRPPRDVPLRGRRTLSFSADGRRLVWHDMSRGTLAWDLEAWRLAGEVSQTGIGYAGDVSIAASPDARRVAVASFHGLEVHDLAAGRRVTRCPGHGGRRVHVRAAAWSPDGARLATGGDDQRVIVWRAPP